MCEKCNCEASQQAAEPLVWESMTPVYIKYITDSRYQKLHPGFQKWYKPICEKCHRAAPPQQVDESGSQG